MDKIGMAGRGGAQRGLCIHHIGTDIVPSDQYRNAEKSRYCTRTIHHLGGLGFGRCWAYAIR